MTARRRAVVYCRISLDATGLGLGVQRQEDECRKLCAAKGWEVVEVVTDNSVSASTGKKRPGWERVLSMIDARAVDVVVAWQVDRMYRSPRDLEDLVTLTENTGVVLATVSGELDLSTPNGRLVARLLGATARQEVEIKAERQKASHRQRAAGGRPWWTSRPFGFERNGDHRADEAALLRGAYIDVLKGSSVYSVAARWNAAGVFTPRGNAWRSTNLRHVLMSPRNAAVHTYQGSETGSPAAWEPIVTEDVFRAVERKLSDPARSPGGGGRRKGLLTGVAVCEVCGARVLQGMGKANKAGERQRMYTCRNGRCVSYPADWLDSIVVRQVVERAEDWIGSATATSTDDTAKLAELQSEELALTSRRAQLAEMFADGTIDAAALAAGTEAANQRLQLVAVELAELAAERVGVSAADWEAVWAEAVEMDQDKLRAIIERLAARIELSPRGKGSRSVSSDLVRITWREHQ